MITLDKIKKLLEYNPETGMVTWKVERLRAKKGDEAGHVSKANGYHHIWIGNQLHRTHRLIWLMMTGSMPEHEVDHKDLNRSNNRWSNLRSATRLQNSANKTKTRRNKSGFKGVSWRAETKKWQAHIYVAGKSRCLGQFSNPIDAHESYRRAAYEAWGEFANVG